MNLLSNNDFLCHLEESLGISESQALSTLGAWLTRYRPERDYELSFLEKSGELVKRTRSRDAA